MNKINQGEFEVFTSKEDAIEKFTQIQGVCREELATGNAIVFYCDADGKITITNPPSKSATRDNATNLYANVIERDGKTYISYNTVYSKTVHVMKYIALVIYVLMSVLGIVVAFVEGTKAALLLCALGTVLFVY